MDKDVLDALNRLGEQFKAEDEKAFREYRKEGLLDMNNGDWDLPYDVLNYNPKCPDCGAEMKWSYGLDLLQCTHCGKLVYGGDYPYSRAPEKDDIDFSTYYTEY